MEKPRPGEIRLRIHGRQQGSQPGDRVLADVFAQKLAALVRALKAADKVANGTINHDYAIADLKMGSAVATLAEQAAPRFMPGTSGQSGIKAFNACISLISEGKAEAGRIYGPVLKPIGDLGRGAGKSFSYGELWVEERPPIRLDGLLSEQVQFVAAKADDSADKAKGHARRWFEGFALGTFDGEIKQVDLRGALPQVKLVLTAGKKEIDCILRDADIRQLRANLDRRVRVNGRAFYDGKSGLPRRIEVLNITPIKRPGNILRWKGAFVPFTPEPWEGDDE